MAIDEAKRYNISIVGISEHRWAGKGHFFLDEGGVLFFARRERSGQSGVGIYLGERVFKCLLGYNFFTFTY